MFHFGVDYYPEQWPEERWPEDARLMAEAGVNVVRLAEFAWGFLEPQLDCFDFNWLDRAIEILYGQGIQIILGTPTASAPPWVMAMLPDAYKVNEHGHRFTYGNRCEFCPSHAGYRERGRLITRAMAKHYADHPAVIGWQIDNELNGRCYCSTCQTGFQDWLRYRYHTLEELNSAWGTAFWSHVYTEWSQVPLPVETGGVPNPSLDLDFRRFMSDTFLSFQQEQVDILRSACPNHFITHNFMGFSFNQINYYDLAKPLDFVSWDNYPRTGWNPAKEVDPAYIALGHDTTRSFKGKPFWVMEEQSGSGGWRTVGVNPRPGEMRLWTFQAIAHGADAIIYFRWRTARFGTEQFWHGVLDHHGRPGRRYDELKTIGDELQRAGTEILGAENRNQVAIIHSYDTRWAFQIQPNHNDFNYPDLFISYYKALHTRNIGVDIVPPDADLSRYRLVIAPALFVLPDETAEKLQSFVRNGGILITTARSGVKDEVNAIVNQFLPGRLAKVCGVEVDEYDVLNRDATIPVKVTFPNCEPQTAQACLWFDVLHTTTAQPIATYQAGYFSGTPAITLNRYGEGQAIYVATLGDDTLHDIVIDWVLKYLDLHPAIHAPSGVEVTTRWQGNQKLVFLLNHTGRSQEVPIPQPHLDLLNGITANDIVKMPPYGVSVLKEEG